MVWQSGRVSIFSMINDVVGDWVAIADRSYGRFARHPRILRTHIAIVLALRHHVVKQALKGPVLGRWVRTDIVGWISRERLGFNLKFTAIEATIQRETQFVGAFCGAMRDFSKGDQRRISTFQRFCVFSIDVKIFDWVVENEVMVRALRIESCVGLLRIYETPVRSYRLYCAI